MATRREGEVLVNMVVTSATCRSSGYRGLRWDPDVLPCMFDLLSDAVSVMASSPHATRRYPAASPALAAARFFSHAFGPICSSPCTGTRLA